MLYSQASRTKKSEGSVWESYQKEMLQVSPQLLICHQSITRWALVNCVCGIYYFNYFNWNNPHNMEM